MRWSWIRIKWIRFVIWQFYDYFAWGFNRRNRQRMLSLSEKIPEEYSWIKNYPAMKHTFKDVEKEMNRVKKLRENKR